MTSRHHITTEILSAESDRLIQLLGSRCFILQSAVTQLAFAYPNPKQWKLQSTGVLCFVKDFNKKSFYFRLFDVEMSNSRLLWEHELYQGFEYRRSRGFFHSFFGESFEIGFNFANEREALTFGDAVSNHIEQRRRKKEARMQQTQQQREKAFAQPIIKSHHHVGNTEQHRRPMTVEIIPQRGTLTVAKKPSSGGKVDHSKKKIDKTSISSPSGFVHVQHFGFGNDRRTSMGGEEKEMLEWFRKLGLSVKEDDAKFAIDFVKNHGGTEKLRQEANQAAAKRGPAPPVPVSQIPPRPSEMRRSSEVMPPRPPSFSPPTAPKSAWSNEKTQSMSSSPPSVNKKYPPPPVPPQSDYRRLSTSSGQVHTNSALSMTHTRPIGMKHEERVSQPLPQTPPPSLSARKPAPPPIPVVPNRPQYNTASAATAPTSPVSTSPQFSNAASSSPRNHMQHQIKRNAPPPAPNFNTVPIPVSQEVLQKPVALSKPFIRPPPSAPPPVVRETPYETKEPTFFNSSHYKYMPDRAPPSPQSEVVVNSVSIPPAPAPAPAPPAPPPPPPPPPQQQFPVPVNPITSPEEESRGSLLLSIQSFSKNQLKKTEESSINGVSGKRESMSDSSSDVGGGSLASALAAALASREKSLRCNCSSSEEESDCDDDWDD